MCVSFFFTLTGRPSPMQILHWISGEIVSAHVPLLWQKRCIVPKLSKLLVKFEFLIKKTNNFRFQNGHYRRNNSARDRIRLYVKPLYHLLLLANKHEDHLRIHTDKLMQLKNKQQQWSRQTKIMLNIYTAMNWEISIVNNVDIRTDICLVDWRFSLIFIEKYKLMLIDSIFTLFVVVWTVLLSDFIAYDEKKKTN